MPSAIRVTWEYDSDPDFSYLEQWDTPEKYYGIEPLCPRCGSYMEYDELHTFICADEDCSKSMEINCDKEQGTNGGVMREDDAWVPFEEYIVFYGNPTRHITLGCYVETKCSCCGEWGVQSSCFGFDFMDTDNYVCGTTDAMDLEDSLLKGYQLEESHDLILEAMTDA